jgi:hypothetical protein
MVHRGVALVDVLIGAVLLAVGLAVVISLTTRSLAIQTDGEKQLTASWLADELLNLVLVEGPVEYPKLHDTNDRFGAPFDEFEYDVAIEDLGPAQPFRVTASVRWASGQGVRQIQAGTLIADRGGDPDLEHREPYEPVDREQRYLDKEEALNGE